MLPDLVYLDAESAHRELQSQQFLRVLSVLPSSYLPFQQFLLSRHLLEQRARVEADDTQPQKYLEVRLRNL